MLDVSLKARLGHFQLDAAFTSANGVTALFGPSGAGKSTVINMIAGLQKPDEGRIVIGGQTVFDSAARIDLRPEKRHVGVVFQKPRLFPHLSVRQNLTFSRWAGRRRIESGRFEHIVGVLGIEPLLERRPAGLSGGEAQRISIGRTLLSDPRLLLLDEPLSALDMARKNEILPWLERLRDEAGIPMIYVSHVREEVTRLASQMVALDQGKVVARGGVDEVLAKIDGICPQ